MDSARIAAYIQRWRPSSVSAGAACFARAVVAAAGPGRAGTGEEPAVGRGQARRLGDRARPGTGPRDPAASVGDRAVRRVRAGAERGDAADATHEPAVPGPACGPGAGAGGRPAAPRAGQDALQPGGDRRLPCPGGRAADGSAADARQRPGLSGGTRWANSRTGRTSPRHDAATPAGGRGGAGRPATGRPCRPLPERLHAAAELTGRKQLVDWGDPARRDRHPPSGAGGRGRAARVDTAERRPRDRSLGPAGLARSGGLPGSPAASLGYHRHLHRDEAEAVRLLGGQR